MALAILMLSACDAAPTPVAPVAQPTQALSADATQAPPLRIAIGADTIDYVEPLAALRAIALVEILDTGTDISTYDLVFAYGDREEWQRTRVEHTVSLIVNPQVAPLDDDGVAAVLRQSLNVQALSNATGVSGVQPQIVASQPPNALRTTLANLGYPDGFPLTVAHTPFHAVNEAQAQLAALNLELRIEAVTVDAVALALADGQVQLVLAQWWDTAQRAAWVDAVGMENVIDLYRLPIEYLSRDALELDFSPAGWPLPQPPDA